MSIKGLFPIEKWDFERGSILAELPASDLALLMKRKTEHEYKKGDIVFREGAFPVGIYFLVRGKAKKYKLDRDGKEQIIYVANTGELLGYHAILSGDSYPDSAAALEDSLIAFIPREDFLAAMEQSGILSRRLLKTLSHEFSVLVNSLALSARRPVRERLALQLILVREKYKTGVTSGLPVEIDLSRDDLASLVGTARENLVRVLTEFKEEGILETRGRKIVIRDIKKLIGIANCC